MEQALQALIRFRDDRDWAQFHDSRNLALALSIEAAELNELFLWKKDGDLPDLQRLKEELADVFAYALLLAHNHQLDPESIVLEKIEQNARKYPVDKSKGRAEKYDQL
ncbi:nucleotide pyrophosphohydrolase [bacterium]|nr:nucleotide pyrophosphohydrolase [bacterium]